MKKQVYNLEFPSWCHEMEIFGYRFYRVADYPSRIIRLQHLANSISEFNIEVSNGENVITAIVDIPEKEEDAVFEWEVDKYALADILLLLSIFTKRDVFVVDFYESNQVILADPRLYLRGGILRCSIPYEASEDDERYNQYDIGFENGINQVYSLIRSVQWQKKYKRGYFLLLAKMAFRRQNLESAFIQCYIIWEHLFSILNDNWLSSKSIHTISSDEKIKFLLVEFGLKPEISDIEQKKIRALAATRNRLVHFGKFTDQVTKDNAILFTQLTEFIIAKTLNLLPSNVLNTLDEMENYLNNVIKSGSS